ncbi:hypothetical protein H311_03979, partial [Anncaliia algerae PRA109]
FITKDKLTRHLKTCGVLYKCKVCDKTYQRYKVLENHMNEYHHEEDILYECDKCKSIYKSKKSYEKHKDKHI